VATMIRYKSIFTVIIISRSPETLFSVLFVVFS
jgi:hypothetical protein